MAGLVGILAWQYLGRSKEEDEKLGGEPITLSKDFEECMEASSLREYCQKAKIESIYDLSEIDKLKPISVPVKINFPDVKIYNIPDGAAGGDVFTIPLIKFDNNYCKLTDSNFQKLFTPIQKEEAIEYLNFRLITLAPSSYQRAGYTITSKEEYNKEIFKTCKKPIFWKKITDIIQETPDGFIINWIYFTPAYDSGVYETRVKVNRDGEIQILREGIRFIDCGRGIMF
ncbi:MAG: hypothetical protein QME61_03860 [Patescibacteria group bacterium]|nr:hypothetical protein [Patescibacteria group bacterium]